MKLFNVWMFLTLVLTACAHSPKKFQLIKPGMTKGQVVQILGQPEDRSFSQGREEWSYTMGGFGDEPKVKTVIFTKDVVHELKTDEAATQRRHELERARAGAPQIQVNAGANGGQPWNCSQWNAHGHYPSGGGCNIYGCWPPGGTCTVFGCSFTSECGAVHCPNKYKSLNCR